MSDVAHDRRLTTGSDSLDSLLGGGFRRGSVAQVYGSPGTGKTNICLQTAVETIRSGGSVVYIDTEGISIERFRQIAGESYEETARDFIINEVYDFEDQDAAVKDVENVASEVDLVVLDSATGLYRIQDLDGGGDKGDRSPLKRLTRQVAHLTSLARKHGVAVVVTNQIYTNIDGKEDEDEYSPLGGKSIEHWTKTIVRLTNHGGRREAVLEKHLSRETGESATFSITSDGVE
ncbi:DNA repair and recombination protein RadB [Halorutilales archaeon Cl-col2-1]